MTPEEARAMPGAFVAFERADGEPFYDEFSWVTSFDARDADYDYHDAPFEVIELVMVPVEVRRFRVGIHEFEPCDDAPDECETCSGAEDSEFHSREVAEPSSPPPTEETE